MHLNFRNTLQEGAFRPGLHWKGIHSGPAWTDHSAEGAGDSFKNVKNTHKNTYNGSMKLDPKLNRKDVIYNRHANALGVVATVKISVLKKG